MIAVIAGTRPEVVKLGPVVAALRAAAVPVTVVLTGQHTTLLADCLAAEDLTPALSLGLASDGNIARWMTQAQVRLTAVLREVQPSLVVVQGDTMSAHVGAITADLLGLPVAHVEAGVRSGDLHDPWPEEQTRVSIAQLATWHYAPTSTAMGNLLAEGIDPARIRVTGNSVVSALARYADVTVSPDPDATIVVTLHRREILTKNQTGLLFGALRLWALANPGVRLVWPMHPHFAKLLGQQVPVPINLVVSPPLGYRAFLRLVVDSLGVLTDSGGLVEECATLGVPCVIARVKNDRPEAVEAGVAAQTAPDAAGIRRGLELLVGRSLRRQATMVYGQPDAAQEIARHLARQAGTH